MKLGLSILFLIVAHPSLNSQELSGLELLNKSIAFHDPEGNWDDFIGSFQVTMQSPNGDARVSEISMNFPQQKFILNVSKDEDRYSYHLQKDSCLIRLNGSSDIKQSEAKRLRLNCERGTLYKNYYTYLYGLPMKLKDPGTTIHEKVETKQFKGKNYLVLKASYDTEVGDDTWYFFFDPKTYAMEVYQFFHDESENDGEYILLDELESVNAIKMPKIRKWFMNKDDKYLGADILN